MEEFTDCKKNNQNTKLLFVNHELKNQKSKVGEKSNNWSSVVGVGAGVDRHSEAAVVHDWVAAAAAVMHVTHLNNNSNNNNVQHCDNMSGNVGFEHESSQDKLSGCSKWNKNSTAQNPWNYHVDVDLEKKSKNMEMQRNGEVCLDALSKLANLVIHDAPQSPVAVSGACCLQYNDSDLEDDDDDDENNFAKLGAAAISLSHQTETSEILLISEETGAVAGCAEMHSNRTSINNSTENLSYSSDNLYANDLMMLEDNGHIDAEEISLNSDDCIYAYRGDGADFDLALDANVLNKRIIGGLGAQAHIEQNAEAGDDETEFLEMDFDPDPLSEAEFSTVVVDMTANTYLMQRNSCHLSGRHSSTVMRQHFSSPTESLQDQSLQCKNFDCINLHLDQINETLCVEENARSLAQSLPNTLHEHFKCASNNSTLNNTNSAEQMHVSNKLTGAKPKRSTTLGFKNPTGNKARYSRSAMGTTYGCSNSFDERSLSCNGFMYNPLENVPPPSMDYLVSMPLTEHNSDEACLDCLEREFLANTIGKVLEPQKECSKCRKRSSSSSSTTLYETAERRTQQCRSSGSSTNYLFEYTTQLSDSCLFDASSEFLCEASTQCVDTHWTAALKAVKPFNSELDQRENNTDLGEKLLKNLLMTEIKPLTLPTENLNEETLTQTLHKLNVNYNQEMLKPYFARYNKNSQLDDRETSTKRKFKNLKEFLLHESKRNGNFAELKRLIEAATRHQVTVKFQQLKDVNYVEATIPVKVSDILYEWSHNKDLTFLLQLGKRFAEANVLGKIAHIIRQSERFGTSMRKPLPEFITIPQYYASGEIIFTKNY